MQVLSQGPAAGRFAVLLLGAAMPAQATWIVDSMGNFDFPTIQAAVNASSPGDVLVVLGLQSLVVPAGAAPPVLSPPRSGS